MNLLVSSLLREISPKRHTPPMPAVKTRKRWLHVFAWPGLLAAVLLAICMAIYFIAILPTQDRLETARRSTISLQEQIARSRNALNNRARTPEEQLDEFYRVFPSERLSPQWLEKLVALAENRGLKLNEGEYKATRDKVGRLVRFQMTLPVTGEYPQIRKFLADLPNEIPIVALDNVQFERQKVADPSVTAKIKLVLYLGQAS